MSAIDQLRTRAGRVLYAELPEEYRYRDPAIDGELGDLEAYLHGVGHLLDLIRETLAQAHADGFAEEVDGRSIQPWLIPYLAELVGAELTAPDPTQRTEELNRAVGWYKIKGTLASIDEVADVVAGAETIQREGWRHVLTCPRVGLPPFSQPPGVTGGAPTPRGCPDFRAVDRAVVDPAGSNPLFRIATAHGEVFWKHSAIDGIPCVHGSYADAAMRTPDLRDPERTPSAGPHPRRAAIHVRPPDGMFDASLPQVDLDPADPGLDLSGLDAATLTAGASTRAIVTLAADLVLPAGRFRIRGLRFRGEVETPTGPRPARIRAGVATRLEMLDCAAPEVTLAKLNTDEEAASFVARNCLFGAVLAPARWAEMEYVTVTGACELARLNASDCIFSSLGDTLVCAPPEGVPPSCLRYSRFDPPPQGKSGCQVGARSSNTTAAPQWARRWMRGEDGVCRAVVPPWGAPGHGVLDASCTPAIAAGAEDDGEMGAHHGFHHAAALRAMRRKLAAFLPIGQEVSIVYDPLAALTPPSLVSGEIPE